jgi:HEAT repeat protein
MRLAEEMLAGKDAQQATSVMWQLASQNTAESKRILMKALDSKEPSVKMAAISSMAQNPDEASTKKLLDMVHDPDASVRSTALSTLGQIGSEVAQNALIDASRSGKPEERVAAISGLANMDDPRASQQLANLMRDADPTVASTAISSSYNGGPEVDTTLQQILYDPNAAQNVKIQAASQLRNRNADIDPNTEAAINGLIGAPDQYGGAGYGGNFRYRGDYMIVD